MYSKNRDNSLLRTALSGLLLLLVLGGCGSVPDKSFQPFEADSHHPFDNSGEHGEYLNANGMELTECMSCHGTDLRGVDNGVVSSNGEKDRSCYKCHNRDSHLFLFTGPWSDHNDYLTQNNWDLQSCYKCHTNTETEGFVFGGSCDQCHSGSPLGPQACNNCHGNSYSDPDNPLNWAPPNDLEGRFDTSEPGVGMHQSHLTISSGNAKVVDCNVCHIVPDAWDDRGHIDDDTPGQAEVIFSYPATAHFSTPSYDNSNNTCSSTNCHFDKTATWTEAGGFSDCTSCHGIPPESPHFRWDGIERQCYFCHGDVIDENGVIIAPELHVNGSINEN